MTNARLWLAGVALDAAAAGAAVAAVFFTFGLAVERRVLRAHAARMAAQATWGARAARLRLPAAPAPTRPSTRRDAAARESNARVARRAWLAVAAWLLAGAALAAALAGPRAFLGLLPGALGAAAVVAATEALFSAAFAAQYRFVDGADALRALARGASWALTV